MSVEIDEIAALTHEIETISHVGRRNRLMTVRSRRLNAIDARPDRLGLLRALLGHRDRSVRRATAWHCGLGSISTEDAERIASEIAKERGEIGEEARRWLRDQARVAASQRREETPRPRRTFAAAPAGCSYEAALELVDASFSPELSRVLKRLLLRSTRLWPRAYDGGLRASCLGGMPVLPGGYRWPSFEGEPFLFLGQINFAELHAAIGQSPFPDRGLLQFYGDEDEVTGCGPNGGGAVFFWDEAEALEPAPEPIEAFAQLPQCGLDFFESAELPHPRSNRVAQLKLSADDKQRYCDLWRKLAEMACPRDYDRSSKLLGWPDLIQRDIGEDCGAEGEPLLAQLGWWHDGVEWQCWGPGGLVYFILSENAIRHAQFGEALMEMQCT